MVTRAMTNKNDIDVYVTKSPVIHIITHGKDPYIEPIKTYLRSLGFPDEKFMVAEFKKVGKKGELVAMTWPPKLPTEIYLREITAEEGNHLKNLGGWGRIVMKDITRTSVPSHTQSKL
jgi:hypothetical protein